MTADNIAENGNYNGRRCYLRVYMRANREYRKIEWHTSRRSYEELEAKVRSVFRLDGKDKLNFLYHDGEAFISMSSDEEWTIALDLLKEDVVHLDVEIVKRKKRGVAARAIRAGKALRPKLLAYYAALAALFSSLRAPPAAPVRNAVRSSLDRIANANISRRRILLSLVVLALGIFMVAHNCPHHRRFHEREFFRPLRPGYHHDGTASVTILSAVYGDKDVTAKTQQYYENHQAVKASNGVYGDPAPRVHKYLQVVYQIAYPYQTFTVSESFAESSTERKLTSSQEAYCPYPDDMYVDGHKITIYGALYNNADVTCAAKRLVYLGSFSSKQPGWNPSRDVPKNVVNYQTFADYGADEKPNGHLTIVYSKNGQLHTFKGFDGSTVSL